MSAPEPKQPRSRPKLIDLTAARLRKSFAEFVRAAWPLVEPEVPLVWGWHLEAICLHLQALYEGRIRGHKLVINQPPGSGKSILSAVMFPAWLWAVQPGYRSIYGSYGIGLAQRDSKKTRDLIRSEWFQNTFVRGEWSVSDDQDRVNDFSNTRTGFRLCVSRDGQGTGHRGHLVVIDDPLSVQQSWSRAERERAENWVLQTMLNRFVVMAEGRFLLTMQRLHDQDPTGALRKAGIVCEVLELAAEFNPGRRCTTSIGWTDPRREAGELMFPAMLGAEVLEQEKKKPSYQAQYNQDPIDSSAAIFKRECWRFWKRKGAPAATRPPGCNEDPAVEIDPDAMDGCLSVDAAFKDTATSDYVVITAVGKLKADRFVLDQSRDRRSFPATIEELKRMALGKWPRLRARLVEDKANGSAIMSTMAREIPGLVPINPKESKLARAHACSAEVNSGNVFLPEGAPWVPGFVDEAERFKGDGKGHDDQVDALTQALNWMVGSDLERTRRLLGMDW